MVRQRYKKDKDGRYNTTVKLADGSRRHISAKTLAELEAKRQRYQDAPPDADITLQAYAVRWFAARAAGWKTKTREMYARMIDVYICDPEYGLGGFALADLRPMHVAEFLVRLRESGGGRHDMRRTCEQALTTLRQIERAAVLDGVIRQQYTLGVRAPRGSRAERRALTPEEQAAVFAADLAPKDRAALLLLYGCGLRRGELLALRAEDFSLGCRAVTVRRGLVYLSNHPVIQDSPKSAAGVRTVPVPEAVRRAVRAYVESAGRGPLFPGRSTEYITQIGFRRMWERIIAAMQAAGADCGGLTPHIFRHNYATTLYYSEVSPLQAADLLGHADTSMLMQVYAHLDREREQVAGKVDAAFPNCKSSGKVRKLS